MSGVLQPVSLTVSLCKLLESIEKGERQKGAIALADWEILKRQLFGCDDGELRGNKKR